MLQATAVNAIACTQSTVSIDQVFGHHKQAHALDAGGRIGQSGQHQVHDVGGHVVLTGADEYLVAGDPVAAIRLWFGLGAHQAQVGAAVRLGQAHGAGPFATGHLGQVGLLLGVGAVGVQRGVSAVRQAGVHGPGLVGAVEHFVKHLVHHQRQALAAKGGVTAQCSPTASYIAVIGLLEALGRGHSVAERVEAAALGVAADIEREQHLGGKLAALFQHGVDGVDIDISVLRQCLEGVGDFEQLVHDKLHVAQRWGIGGHGGYSWGWVGCEIDR